MNWRSYLLLYLLGLGILSVISRFQHSPGYMDADYYLAGGLRLSGGYGFSEQILWNYLDDPSGLPHPSHAYWMPAASILAAIGMSLFPVSPFDAAQFAFVLVAALTPPLTAALSFSLTGRRDLAWLAGLLALLPGFYLPFMTTSDVFGLYMLFGALFFLLLGLDGSSARRLYGISFLLGLVTGAMHFTRTEGALWFVLALLAVSLKASGGLNPTRHLHRWVPALVLCGLGYLLLMAPWMVRNLRLFGAPLAPGGLRALWITHYDELYSFPAEQLTWQHWLNRGWGAVLRARFWAAGQNLQSAMAVQGSILLSPFILLGLWQLRQDLRVCLALLAWLLTFLLMTLVFPYQGARGGFFHAAAALQPLLWAVAPLGLESAVSWVGARRHWNLAIAQPFFRVGVLALMGLLTVFLSFNRLRPTENQSSVWDAGFHHYQAVEAQLQAWGALPGQIVLVNNAPGYYVANRRPALSIPYGDLETTRQLAQRFQATYLLLEFDQIQGASALYNQPADQAGWRYLGSVAETRLYRFQGP